jgi:hypothetical protein
MNGSRRKQMWEEKQKLEKEGEDVEVIIKEKTGEGEE